MILLFCGCMVMNEPEEKIVGSVHYTHQVSKKEIEYEPGWLVPKSTIAISRLNYDATTQIVFTKNSGYKKHRGEYYLYHQSRIDTLKLTEPDSRYTPNDYFLSGNFKRPAGKMPNWLFDDLGIIFYSDGNCVHTTVANCSDSPCSTTTQTKGRYRTSGDTIYTTQFVTRSLHSGVNYPYHDSIKTIDDISWSMREPSEEIYVLSRTDDTLYNVSKSYYPKTAYYLLGSDSLIRIQGR